MRVFGVVGLGLGATHAFVSTSGPLSTCNSPSLWLGTQVDMFGSAAEGGMSMMAERKKVIAGNLKMNPTTAGEAIQLAKDVVAQTKGCGGVDIIMAPPHPFLLPVAEQLAGSDVKLAAQNCYIMESGAYTGAVSTSMIKSCGCEYVILGHSERRVIFKEDDETINEKVKKVLARGLTPILCIGESKDDYEAGLNKEICAVMLGKDLTDVSAEDAKRIIIAYEPVWAIGTGLTATPEIAQGVHAYIRSWLAEKYGKAIADEIRIQYGGSVTPETVDDLMACPDIDGALVGGASLVAEKFSRIVGFKTPVSA
ncbi:unnamed protein product [Chrysoparadoxa australica]